MSDTPRTDAMRLKMAQLGWPSDGEPVAMLMASHDQIERELADSRAWSSKLADVADDLRAELVAERELADRLAGLLQRDRDGYGGQKVDPECDCCDCEYLRPIDEALAAWKEARSE